MNWNRMTWHFYLVIKVGHCAEEKLNITVNAGIPWTFVWRQPLPQIPPTVCHAWYLPKCCGENCWVTVSKCKQRHMTLHPHFRSWMSRLQECTSALRTHCQLQTKKSISWISLTVTSSGTWISTDQTSGSRVPHHSKITHSGMPQHIIISCAPGSLDLVSRGSRGGGELLFIVGLYLKL